VVQSENAGFAPVALQASLSTFICEWVIDVMDVRGAGG